MTGLTELQNYCNGLLRVGEFEDYCPNGLQVEAGNEVSRLVSGVTASQALINAAVALGADTLLVHHGYFWKGEAACLTGPKGRRIRTLMRYGISLLAYHLPLDAHSQLGNNRQLGLRLGLPQATPVPGEPLLWWAELPTPTAGERLAQRFGECLGRTVLHVPGSRRQIRRLAWCSGAAQGWIERAAARGADAYLSGEISEPTVYQARELGLDYFAAGHHATERYGVQALGEHLAERFGIVHQFLDIANPA
jgi:dinuclear metal center YbgI/SA1388 family protein